MSHLPVEPWNKGKVIGNPKLRGRPLDPETVAKRTASRRAKYPNGYSSGKPETLETKARRSAGWAKRHDKYGLTACKKEQ